MKDEAAKDEGIEKVGVWDVITCKNPDWKMPLIICMVLHAGQQLSGINAVSSFADDRLNILPFFNKKMKLFNFIPNSHSWSHHEKCIQISTNMICN